MATLKIASFLILGGVKYWGTYWRGWCWCAGVRQKIGEEGKVLNYNNKMYNILW